MSSVYRGTLILLDSSLLVEGGGGGGGRGGQIEFLTDEKGCLATKWSVVMTSVNTSPTSMPILTAMSEAQGDIL